MTPRLKTTYKESVIPKLMESRKYKNRMQVPGLKKIVLNLCVSVNNDRDTLTALADDLGKITARRRSLPKRRRVYRILSFARVCRLVHGLPCVMIVCTSLWIAW